MTDWWSAQRAMELVLGSGQKETVGLDVQPSMNAKGCQRSGWCSVLLMWHWFCWCHWYFNQSSETSRADLQLDLRLDVLRVWMKAAMRLHGDIQGCLDDCPPVWWQTYPKILPPLQMCGENPTDVGTTCLWIINQRSFCGGTKKVEEPSRKFTPVKVKVDRSKIDTRLQKPCM